MASAPCYVAVFIFRDRLGLLIIATTGAVIAIALLLRKVVRKPATEAPPVKLFRPRFTQTSGTPNAELRPNPLRHYASCHCLDAQYKPDESDEDDAGEHAVRPKWQELLLHAEIQDTSSDAWKSLEAYITKVCNEGSEELNPRRGIGSEKWEQIITLPKSIRTLKSVKVLSLYGSHLVRIPPEIGDMTNLEEFDPYTSRCLPWFPYEITRCKRLKSRRQDGFGSSSSGEYFWRRRQDFDREADWRGVKKQLRADSH
jgi:hypothetical protein